MSVFLAASPLNSDFPAVAGPLEEVCADGPRDMAPALAFALSRAPADDRRPVVLAVPRAWLGEYGRPYSPALGLDHRGGLVLVTTRTGIEGLWVMEQALRSGAAALVLGAVDPDALGQTRRLDFAARHGGAVGLILRRRADGLSAAHRRWTVAAAPAPGDADDRRAPGGPRLRVELTRSRSERPGFWMLEQDDETHRLRLADRLAGDGPGAIGRTDLAA